MVHESAQEVYHHQEELPEHQALAIATGGIVCQPIQMTMSVTMEEERKESRKLTEVGSIRQAGAKWSSRGC